MIWNVIAALIALLSYLGMLVVASLLVWLLWALSGGNPIMLLIGAPLPLAIGYFGFRRLFGPADGDRSTNA